MVKGNNVGPISALIGPGVIMLCLGMALCSIGSIMSTSALSDLGYKLAMVLTVICLLIPGTLIWMFTKWVPLHRPIAIGVIVGASSLACWLILRSVLSTGSDPLPLALLAGLHGVLWSLWYMRLAFIFQSYPPKAALLCILAATTSFLGIMLAAQSQFSKLSAVTEVAWYALFIGIQILLTSVYLHRESKTYMGFQSEVTLQQLPMADDSRFLKAQRSAERSEPAEKGLHAAIE